MIGRAVPNETLSTLLCGFVDYAGLFPPASLSMSSAVANFNTYKASDERDALGRFVAPAARLDEFVTALTALPRAAGAPWSVSLLVRGPHDFSVLSAFRERSRGLAIIDCAEGRADTPEEVSALAAAAPSNLRLFVELGLGENFEDCLRAIRAAHAHAKIRMGGVEQNAFPDVASVVRFLTACHREGVSFKATAGLHHPMTGEYPLTYERGSAVGRMYGYLNMLVATELVRLGRSEPDVVEALRETDARSLERRLAAVDVTGIRQVALGIGSCSFREPVDELARLFVPTTTV